MSLRQHLARMIAPPVCVLCGGQGQQLDETWGLDLCVHCEAACPRAVLVPTPSPRPAPDADPLPALATAAGAVEGAFCLFRYEDPVDQLILRLKFQGELACARVLGTLFARAWRGAQRELPECLVPMPLHRTRYVERGFCQTSEIARHIARRLQRPDGSRLPVRRELLQRVRATRAQSELSAVERATNLRGAFACRAGAAMPRHIALLDDVLTTGSTARAAIGALQAAGAGRVELWCCARA